MFPSSWDWLLSPSTEEPDASTLTVILPIFPPDAYTPSFPFLPLRKGIIASTPASPANAAPSARGNKVGRFIIQYNFM